MITQGEMLWSLNKFFQLILYGNVWRSVWRICMWILGFKGLKGKYRILHNTSQMSAANEWNIFQHEKRNFLSPSDYVMCNVLFYYISTNEILIYYVAIATVIFSHVEITCYFHVWRYHVFTGKLTWYFIGVYMIRVLILCYSVCNWQTWDWQCAHYFTPSPSPSPSLSPSLHQCSF